MVKGIFIAVLLILFCFEGVSSVSYADSAAVLPKGITRGRMVSTKWLRIDERYNESGDIEGIDTNYNRDLTNEIFPRLIAVENAFGMPAGSANLGKTNIEFDLNLSIQNFVMSHGITDKLTAAVNIPYWAGQMKVKKAELDTSNATVGKSAIGAGFGAPMVPLAGGGPFGDAVPLTSEDIQDLIGCGLDTNGDGTPDVPGMGYRRFKTAWDEGFGDIETFLKYQYLKTDNWRLAVTGGVRFPTGPIDDPDNLNDIHWATGAGTLGYLLRLNNDFTGIKNHVINGTIKYDLMLSDRQELRILSDANNPITVEKERVKRDVGDILELEISETYTPLDGLSFSLLYNFKHHKKDRISGDQAHLINPLTGKTRFNYNSLEEESDLRSHIIKVGVSYSTVELYKEKKFPVPMSFNFAYRNRVDGKNNYTRSQYVQFGMSVFF